MSGFSVRIECEGAATLAIDRLEFYQGNLKNLSEENYEKLKKQILIHGFSEPVTVWSRDGKNYLLNGHQRVRVLKYMRDTEGFEIPELPVNFVYPKDEREAKRLLLALTSQYGEITRQGLYEFISDAEITIDELSTSVRLPEIDLEIFKLEYFGNPEGGLGDGEEGTETAGESPYTKKIQIPIYEPKGECPTVEDLLDRTRTSLLLERIEAADIPESVKRFLRLAAQRHIVFNYSRIAEYYAHAQAEVQKLMEESALVIIDFNKAIEEGFVVLTDEIAGQFSQQVEAEDNQIQEATIDDDSTQ